MSVLNKMLKDLEQRQGRLPSNAGIPSGVHVVGQRASRRLIRRRGVMIGVLMALLIAGAYWLSNRFAYRMAETVEPVAVSERTAPPQGSVSAPVALPAPTVAIAPPQTLAVPPNSAPAAQSVQAPEPAPEPSDADTAKAIQPQPKPIETQRLAVPATPSKSSESTPVKTLDRIASEPKSAKEPAPTAQASNRIDPAANVDIKQTSPAQRLEFHYQNALELAQNGRNAEAENLLKTILDAEPRHGDARRLLARLHLGNKQSLEAERVLREGQDVDGGDPSWAMALARLQVDRGDGAAALQTLNRSADAGQRSADYMAFQGTLHQQQGRHDEAERHFERALQLKPRTGKWLLALGISQHAQGKLSEARGSLSAAAAHPSLSPELRALAQQRLEQLNGAPATATH